MFALPFGYNYVRFGTFIRMPYDKYLLATPERLEVTHGGHVFQPVNVWPNFKSYFDPTNLQTTRRFPYFYTKMITPGASQNLEYWEPFASVTSTMTGILVLTLVGLVGFVSRPRLLLVLAGAGATLIVTCSFTSLSERYIDDFLPGLTLLASAGGILLATRRDRWAITTRVLIAGLFLLSIAQFTAFALTFQRLTAPDTKGENSTGLRTLLGPHGRFGAKAPHPISSRGAPPDRSERLERSARAQPGLLVRRNSPPGMLESDGQWWHLVSGTCAEILEVNLKVTLPPDDRPTAEPLVAVGKPGVGTIVMLRSDGSGNWSAACDVWGQFYRWGPDFRPPSRTFRLRVVLDRINGRVEVTQDRTIWLDVRRSPHPFAGQTVHIGENPIGGSFCGPTSSGHITELPPSK